MRQAVYKLIICSGRLWIYHGQNVENLHKWKYRKELKTLWVISSFAILFSNSCRWALYESNHAKRYNGTVLPYMAVVKTFKIFSSESISHLSFDLAKLAFCIVFNGAQVTLTCVSGLLRTRPPRNSIPCNGLPSHVEPCAHHAMHRFNLQLRTVNTKINF